MRKGELVNFYSTHTNWQKDYARRNPGLIIAVEHKRGARSGSAYVLWNTGEITKEHSSYLKLLEGSHKL